MTVAYADIIDTEEFRERFYKAQSRRFSLRETVQGVLRLEKPLERIGQCGENNYSSPAIVVPEAGNPYFSAEFCGLSSCPYCASKNGAIRLADLEAGIKSFMELFPLGSIVMMVITFSHSVADALADIGARFSEAKKLFFENGSVKRLLKEYGLAGRVTAPETTWSHVNGFHPHEHILFFFEQEMSADDVSHVREKLALYWVSSCKASGLESDPERFYFELGVWSRLAEYVNKCAREVTLSDLKMAKNKYGVPRYTPFQLAAQYGWTGQEIFAEKFREYALFVKGRKSHQWSRGLASLLKVKNYADDQETEVKDDRKEIIIMLEPDVISRFSGDDKALLLAHLVGDSMIERIDSFLELVDKHDIEESIASFRMPNGKEYTRKEFTRLFNSR